MRIIRNAGYGNVGCALDIEDVLSRPLFAHLATASADGPRESPCWFLWEDRAIWIISNPPDSFPSRIIAEPRCAIGIVDFDPNIGRVHHVGMRGTATIQAWDPSRASRLLTRYLGGAQKDWDARFTATLENFENRFVRFTPQTVVIRDQSYSVVR